MDDSDKKWESPIVHDLISLYHKAQEKQIEREKKKAVECNSSSVIEENNILKESTHNI